MIPITVNTERIIQENVWLFNNAFYRKAYINSPPPFVYNLSTKSFAYNIPENACRLFLHRIRVMRI